MTKQNTANAASPAADLRQRAARARDAAGRFTKRTASIQAAPIAPAAEEIMEGWRAWHATLGKPEGDPEADAAYERAAEHRYALIDATEDLPPTLDNVVAKALAICWLEYVAEVSPGKQRSEQPFTGRLALDIHEAIMGRLGVGTPNDSVDWLAPPPGFIASPAIEPFSFARISHGIAIELDRLRGIATAEFERRVAPDLTAQQIEQLRRELHLDALSPSGYGCAGLASHAGPPSLVGMLDLASATIDELRAIQNIADHVGAVAYAYTWGPRCGMRVGPWGAIEHNGIGRLMHWLGDALTSIETAVDMEVARRVPATRADRETRLSMRASLIIDNGDPDAVEAFARELLELAAAERRGY